MRYEPLTDGHIGGLQQIWNEEWAHMFPMRERILEQNVLQDRNVVLGGTRVAIDETTERIAGYVVAKRWQDQAGEADYARDIGWIHTLFVAPAYRGQGLGSTLLQCAEAVLQAQGVKHVRIGNDLHLRVFPGVPESSGQSAAWLEKRGYVRNSVVYDLFRDFEGERPEPLPRNANAVFRMLKADEADKFNAFMSRCFPEWLYQTLHYWMRGGDGREFVVCEREGAIVGFCRINDSHSPILTQNVYWSPLFAEELGGIGPLGIDEQYRGHGYGLDIVKAGIHFLQVRGIGKMVIDMTPYVDFYGKLGFKRWRSYASYHKQLRDNERGNESNEKQT